MYYCETDFRMGVCFVFCFIYNFFTTYARKCRHMWNIVEHYGTFQESKRTVEISTVLMAESLGIGGLCGARTHDIMVVTHALSQLS